MSTHWRGFVSRRRGWTITLAIACGVAVAIGLAWWLWTARAARIQGALEVAQHTAALPSCEVQFVGASTLAYWQTLARDLAPLTVANLAVAGTGVDDVARQFASVEQLNLERSLGLEANQPSGRADAPAVGDVPPQAIVFYAGENDIVDGRSAADIVAAFDRFMTAKRAKFADTRVYYISLKPSPRRWQDLATQAEVNDTIRALAGRLPDLDFINVVPAMLRNGRPGPWYIEDDLHLNAAGYAVWTPIMRAALKQEIDRQQAGRCRSL